MTAKKGFVDLGFSPICKPKRYNISFDDIPPPNPGGRDPRGPFVGDGRVPRVRVGRDTFEDEGVNGERERREEEPLQGTQHDYVWTDEDREIPDEAFSPLDNGEYNLRGRLVDGRDFPTSLIRRNWIRNNIDVLMDTRVEILHRYNIDENEVLNIYEELQSRGER